MPDRVQKVALGQDEAQEKAELADFFCGMEPWAQEVSAWVRGVDPDDSLWMDLKRPGTRVWIYYNSGGDLVGIGALGHTDWSVKKKQSKCPITILTNLAVAQAYQGKPKREGEVTYGKQILRDLRAEAEKSRAERPLLCLCVHPDNPAHFLYEKEGFCLVEPPTLKTGYLRMALDLDKPPPRS